MTVRLPELMKKRQDAILIRWFAQDGDMVQEGSPLYEIEFQKISSTKMAPATGRFKKLVEVGTNVKYDQALAEIEETA